MKTELLSLSRCLHVVLVVVGSNLNERQLELMGERSSSNSICTGASVSTVESMQIY